MAIMHQQEAAFAALQETMQCNGEFFRLLAAYLTECPRLVTPALIKELMTSCTVSVKEAFCAILSAAFGWEEELHVHHRRLSYEYLTPAVRQLDAAAYRSDPYYTNVRVSERRVGKWLLTQASYAPYEGFVCGPLTVDDSLRELPSIGFFTEPFSYPMVMEDGVEWMAIKPNEIETMRAPIAQSHGRVLAYGLGMGYFAYMAVARNEVADVTVIERDPAVIQLFSNELLPQFPMRDKIHVICADAFEFAQSDAARAFDYTFVDLWHDASDGLPLYIRMRKIEAEKRDAPYVYWVEDMLLSHLRSMVFDGLCGKDAPHGLHTADIYTMLKDPYLRRLAPDLRATVSGAKGDM